MSYLFCNIFRRDWSCFGACDQKCDFDFLEKRKNDGHVSCPSVSSWLNRELLDFFLVYSCSSGEVYNQRLLDLHHHSDSIDNPTSSTCHQLSTNFEVIEDIDFINFDISSAPSYGKSCSKYCQKIL
ncbi:hypothetical protein O6H91_10G040300 [Diphasiastrum complanatum]|uniref:Uncharacterized protein n=1 Tax=Diphasiastrum complanatum TaxID=34168 RepID=A0ACC2CG80_DIPCM|nr:hypothetical protein O6H91_10G040300 [Diphasiastrum complanatum]